MVSGDVRAHVLSVNQDRQEMPRFFKRERRQVAGMSAHSDFTFIYS